MSVIRKGPRELHIFMVWKWGINDRNTSGFQELVNQVADFPGQEPLAFQAEEF